MNIKYYCPLSCLNIVVMLCATVHVAVGLQTLAGAYFSEPFKFIGSINQRLVHCLSLSPSHTRHLCVGKCQRLSAFNMAQIC